MPTPTPTAAGHGSADTSTDPRVRVTILTDRCAGCQECVVRCPTSALSMDPARWVAVADDSACVGCRQCLRTCPFSAITVDGPTLVAPRTALSVRHPRPLDGSREETRSGIRGWNQAAAEAARCLACPDPTCVLGCPAHNDIPSFVAAVRDRDLDRAHRVLRRTSVLPDVCSRVCDQALQCEGACTWSLAGGQPVAIGALERFVADNAPVPPPERVGDGGAGLDVAIVGSGPAGLAAAWELAQAGAAVTVLEKDDEPGGLLRWGIPDFTLPQAVSDRPWSALLASGQVALHCNTEVGPGQLRELATAHDAVIMAHGAGMPLRLPVEGGELDGVWDATRFLVQARRALAGQRGLSALIEGSDPSRQGSPMVLVIGAGNTAMDVARLARRLGAMAICVDWMDERFAPVRPDELDEARGEGVDIRFLTTLARIEGRDGRAVRAWFHRTRQRRAGAQPTVVGRHVAAEGVDLVVMAMGYRRDPEFATALPIANGKARTSGPPDRRWQASGVLGSTPAFARDQDVGGLALARERTRSRSALSVAPGVWVVGDALTGPATVVEAMAQGRRAAQAILDEHAAQISHR